MKRPVILLLMISVFSFAILSGCSDDASTTDDMEETDDGGNTDDGGSTDDGTDDGGSGTDVLSGFIDGNAWEFEVGKVTKELDGKIVFELLGTEVDGSICDVFLTDFARIKFILPEEATGTYDQPRDVETESVRFFPATGGGTRVTATSGSVEITEITTTEIIGIIDATGDDDNNAKGMFTVSKCGF